MKTTELIAIIFAIISGGSLAIIQMRYIGKEKLSFMGTKVFKEAKNIKLDKTDKKLVLVSGISFLLCMIFTLLSYS